MGISGLVLRQRHQSDLWRAARRDTGGTMKVIKRLLERLRTPDGRKTFRPAQL